MVKNGIDRVNDYQKIFQGKRIGLLTNGTGQTNTYKSDIELFCDHFLVTALFAPEHGIHGDIGPGVTVDSFIDPIRNLPVYSLYQKQGKRFPKEGMDLIDAVVYDISDVGTRYYTYLSTMILALYDCKKYNKELIILDRINPLSGTITEGCVLKKEYQSFVGPYTIPIRYGLTVGELALMVNEEEAIFCKLTVIPVKGWKRSQLFAEMKGIWILPSPNIPRFETALLYPGMCLLEGTNLSEGRGTTCPFEMIGAPFMNAEQLTKELMEKKLRGVVFTPAYFRPSCSKYAGELCQGVHIHITDIYSFESYKTGLTVLELIKNEYPDRFSILFKEGDARPPMISLLHGNNRLETMDWSVDELMEIAESEILEFKKREKNYHLYHE